MKARPKRSTPANRKKLRVGSASLLNDVEPDYFEDDYYQEEPRFRGLTVPKRWINTIVGLFLLPLAGVWTQTFFSLFSQQTIHHHFWASEEFWFFSLGALLWVITFFGLPRPLVVYVFGHELTHAIWVWLMGGRVSEFKVGRAGGHIMTDKQNFWIALAPYFYPIYSVLVVILYGIASLFWDMTPHTRWLFLALGVTWSFHISFTIWMIPKGQSDLTSQGTFFSLVIIYLMNVILLTALVILAAPNATCIGFAREFIGNASTLAHWTLTHLRELAAQYQ